MQVNKWTSVLTHTIVSQDWDLSPIETRTIQKHSTARYWLPPICLERHGFPARAHAQRRRLYTTQSCCEGVSPSTAQTLYLKLNSSRIPRVKSIRGKRRGRAQDQQWTMASHRRYRLVSIISPEEESARPTALHFGQWKPHALLMDCIL